MVLAVVGKGNCGIGIERVATGEEEGCELFGVVVIACGLLHSGAAAEIPDARGQRAGPAAARGPLDDEDLRAGAMGLERGAGARSTLSGHDDIDFLFPLRHVCGTDDLGDFNILRHLISPIRWP